MDEKEKDMAKDDRTPGLKEKFMGLIGAAKAAPEKLLGKGVLREAAEAKKTRKQKIDQALKDAGV